MKGVSGGRKSLPSLVEHWLEHKREGVTSRHERWEGVQGSKPWRPGDWGGLVSERDPWNLPRPEEIQGGAAQLVSVLLDKRPPGEIRTHTIKIGQGSSR